MSQPKQKKEWLTVNNIGIIFGILAILITILGLVLSYDKLSIIELISDLWDGLAMEMASIALTILIIDRLSSRRQYRIEERQEQERLVRQLGSSINHDTLRATAELRGNGWLSSGLLRQAKLTGANLMGADLSGADLSEADLMGANLEGVNLRGARLDNVSLSLANMKNADLEGAQLKSAVLTGANLEGANLKNAQLIKATLIEVNLSGVSLAGANLENSRGLLDEQLKQAYMLAFATMPDGSIYDNAFNLAGDVAMTGGTRKAREDEIID